MSSFLDDDENRVGKLKLNGNDKEAKKFFPIAKQWLEKLAPILDVPIDQTSTSELIAFSAFAVAFPTNFLALVDTYNVVRYNCLSYIDCVYYHFEIYKELAIDEHQHTCTMPTISTVSMPTTYFIFRIRNNS